MFSGSGAPGCLSTRCPACASSRRVTREDGTSSWPRTGRAGCVTVGFGRRCFAVAVPLGAWPDLTDLSPLVRETGTALSGGSHGLSAIRPLRPSAQRLPRPGARSAPTALATAFSARMGRRGGESLHKFVGLRALKLGRPPGAPQEPRVSAALPVEEGQT